MRLTEELQQQIRARHKLWRAVCILSLELLEGTDTHVDKVLSLFRQEHQPAQREWQDAYGAAYAASNAANTDAATSAANTAAYAAYAAANATAATTRATAAANTAAYAATNAANAAAYAGANAANAANAKVAPDKVTKFIADLTLLVRFAPDEEM